MMFGNDFFMQGYCRELFPITEQSNLPFFRYISLASKKLRRLGCADGQEPIRIAIVDDEMLLLKHSKAWVTRRSDFILVGLAKTGKQVGSMHRHAA